MAALELGNYLIQTPSGEMRIRRMIVDDIDAALNAGDRPRVVALKLCLKHYLEHHAGRPDTAPTPGEPHSR
jgi:hypothetical protein